VLDRQRLGGEPLEHHPGATVEAREPDQASGQRRAHVDLRVQRRGVDARPREHLGGGDVHHVALVDVVAAQLGEQV
jgi:hypothetical protein